MKEKRKTWPDLTDEQKIKLIMGADFWTNYDAESAIYRFVVSDGPVGLRQPLDRMTADQHDCIKSVAYPSFQMLSQTWDPALAYEMGKSLGNDCIEQKVDILLAPGGDLFELTPVDPYTPENLRWTDENSRVVREYENENLRDIELVSATPENWENYETVFIGYPIWWGIAAWPVNGFAEANDFTGKTVIPFCTSSSSGLGESGRLLADLAGEGNWLTGHRFRSSASENDVRDWLGELGVI